MKIPWCARCDRSIGECQCPDIEERLEACRMNGWLVFWMCHKCFKYIGRCKCIPRGRAILTTDH